MTKKSDFNWDGYEQTTRAKSIGIWVGMIILLGFISIFFFKKEPAAVEKISQGEDSAVFTTLTGPFSDAAAMIEFAEKYQKESYSVEIIENEFVQIGKYRYKNFAVDFSNKLKSQGFFCSVAEWKQGDAIDDYKKKFVSAVKEPAKPAMVSEPKKEPVKPAVMPVSQKEPEKHAVMPVSQKEPVKPAVMPVSQKEPAKPVMVFEPKNEPAKPEVVSLPKKEPIKTVEPDKYWTIQLGAFGAEENAEMLIKNLIDNGYTPTTYVAAIQPRYRVQCGRFKTRDECERSDLFRSLSEKGFFAYIKER